MITKLSNDFITWSTYSLHRSAPIDRIHRASHRLIEEMSICLSFEGVETLQIADCMVCEPVDRASYVQSAQFIDDITQMAFVDLNALCKIETSNCKADHCICIPHFAVVQTIWTCETSRYFTIFVHRRFDRMFDQSKSDSYSHSIHEAFFKVQTIHW